MKTKGKGKSKRDKAESKAIIGIVLAAIMLASVFAGISASAIADDNTANESVDDSGNIEAAVGSPVIIGEITYEKGLNTPTGNIRNTTTQNKEILQIKFTADKEDIDINNITVKQIGSVNYTNFTNVSVWIDAGTLGKCDDADTLVGWENNTDKTKNNTDILINFTQNNLVVPEGGSKYVLVCVNYTNFTMGTCFQMNMTKFNATGNLSKASATTTVVPGKWPLSNTRCGTGTLAVSRGAKDVNVTNPSLYVDAGENTAGIPIMQLNFTPAIEGCKLKNITLYENGTANGSKDINTIYLVRDENSDGYRNATDTIVTNLGTFSADNASTTLAFSQVQGMAVDTNYSYLVVVNTTKCFWAAETLRVNVSSFKAEGNGSGLIVDTDGTVLSSNTTTGQAKIKVELGDTQPRHKVPLGTQVNVEILQLNFTATAGKVNITNIHLQAGAIGGSEMDNDIANATYPKIWRDVNGNGRVDCDDTSLNTTAMFNVSKQLYPFGVNFNLTATNLTVGGTEDGCDTDSTNLIVAVNTTLPNHGDWIKLVINRTNGGYNYTAMDVINNKLINDTSADIFGGVTEEIIASSTFIANPLFIEKGANSSSMSVSAGENTNVGVLQLNFTNRGDTSMKVLYITVNENGSANETDIGKVAIVKDTDADGSKDASDPILDSKSFGTDNANVTFTIPAAYSEIAAGGSTHYLVLVNTSTSFAMNDVLKFNVLDPSIDCVVTDNAGGTFEITNHSEVAIVGHNRTAAGTIKADFTGKPAAGNVSASVNVSCTCLPLMQLNFTAGTTEPVNVTNITITWNGTASNTSIMTIMVINDTNANARYDPDDDVVLNDTAVFANNRSLIDLTPNNLTVNNGANNVSTMLICAYTNKSNLSHGETLAINISERSTQYNATGTLTGLTLKDLYSGELASYVQTAKDSGKLLIDAANIPADTIIKGNRTDVVLMNLTFTRVGEYINVTSIRIRANSTFNESKNNNVTGVALRMDGQIISRQRKDFTKDNGTVFLEASQAIRITDNKTVEIVANISSSVTAGSEIVLRLENPARDVAAIGLSSDARIQNETTTAIYSPQNVTVTGSVDVAKGINNNTAAGPITAMGAVDHNRTAILQLNFSASYEPINITGINVTWLGSPNAATCNITVVAYNDTNGTIANDGIWDVKDTRLGENCFNVDNTTNVSFIINPLTNLTVPSGSYANMLICLNVTDGYDFTPGKKLQINVTNYTAVGVTSEKTITHGTPMVSKILTGTGNITVVNGAKTPAGQDIVACANTTVPVWQLNMSTNHENATLESITLTFNGTANVTTDIAKVDLYYDANSNGTVEAANDTLIASGTISNSKVTLTPTAFYVNTTVKSLLVTVNTTSEFKDNETIAFNITVNTTAPKMKTPDVRTKGVTSGTIMATNYTVPMNSNILTGKCCIDVYNMTPQPTGPVYNQSATNNVEVLKLNFSAPCCNVDILNITLKENGTAKVDTGEANYGVKNISVWYDSKCYNSTAQFATENGLLVINTTGLKLNCLATNIVTIKVNTTGNLTTGQTLFFEVNRTLGTGYNATCNASQETPYSSETGEINNTITVTAPIAVVEIGLDTNWNLISLWLIPANKSIDVVTASINNSLDGVYYYDAYTGSWKSYFPSWGVGTSSLKEMDTGEGYWVNMTAADTLPVSGSFLPSGGVTPPSYPVYTGWNLMGFHSENTTTNASTYFGTQGTDWQSIFKWNNQTDSYDTVRPTTTLNKGEGYWLAALRNYTVYPM